MLETHSGGDEILAAKLAKLVRDQVLIRAVITRQDLKTSGEMCRMETVFYTHRVNFPQPRSGFVHMTWDDGKTPSSMHFVPFTFQVAEVWPEVALSETETGSRLLESVKNVVSFWRRNLMDDRGVCPKSEWFDSRPFAGVLMVSEGGVREELVLDSRIMLMYYGRLQVALENNLRHMRSLVEEFDESMKPRLLLLEELEKRLSAVFNQIQTLQARRVAG